MDVAQLSALVKGMNDVARMAKLEIERLQVTEKLLDREKMDNEDEDKKRCQDIFHQVQLSKSKGDRREETSKVMEEYRFRRAPIEERRQELALKWADNHARLHKLNFGLRKLNARYSDVLSSFVLMNETPEKRQEFELFVRNFAKTLKEFSLLVI